MLFNEFKKKFDIVDGCVIFDSAFNLLGYYYSDVDFGGFDHLIVSRYYRNKYGSILILY